MDARPEHYSPYQLVCCEYSRGFFLGAWIPSPEKKYGLDFALPAMFIGLLVLQFISRKKVILDLLVVAGAVALFVAFSFVLSGYIAVIAATVLAACLGMVLEKWK